MLSQMLMPLYKLLVNEDLTLRVTDFPKTIHERCDAIIYLKGNFKMFSGEGGSREDNQYIIIY
jgi:hypothetical protein